MTALKPIDNRRVLGVAYDRYPLNEFCAHPECWELTDDPHHIFPRSLIGGDSWFVVVDVGVSVSASQWSEPFPHVIGLCRAHHEAVEIHDAWIRLIEDDYMWFDRRSTYESERDGEQPGWELIGSLDPQPARGEKTRKPVRRLQGEERRKRKRVSIALPDDWEDGGALWDEMIEESKDWLYAEGVFGDRGRIPVAETIFAVYHDWLTVRRHTPREEEFDAHQPA